MLLVIVIEFDENNHSDRSEYSEERHLEVIRRWAKESHGLEHLYALRINERGLFKKTITWQPHRGWPSTQRICLGANKQIYPQHRKGSTAPCALVPVCFGSITSSSGRF